MIWVLLAIGIGGALATLVWGRKRSARSERHLYAAILIAMQALYLGFVIIQPSARGFAVEAGFLLVCLGLAAGGRRVILLLPVGYLFHGLWDLRHATLLTEYVPSGYPEICVAYDWLLMLYFVTRLKAWTRS